MPYVQERILCMHIRYINIITHTSTQNTHFRSDWFNYNNYKLLSIADVYNNFPCRMSARIIQFLRTQQQLIFVNIIIIRKGSHAKNKQPRNK